MKVILTGFHSTAVVNIMTATKAYYIFARPTIVEQVTYPMVTNHDLDDFHLSLHAKLEARGWSRQTTYWDQTQGDRAANSWEGKFPYLHTGGRKTAGCRRVGDPHTWAIKFPMEGVRRPEKPDSVHEYSEFYVTRQAVPGENDDQFGGQYRVDARLFVSPVLKYTYTHDFILNRFGPWLMRFSKRQFLRMSPEQRPYERSRDYSDESLKNPRRHISYHLPHGYKLPDNWRWEYWDKWLPQYYDDEERVMKERGGDQGQCPWEDKNTPFKLVGPDWTFRPIAELTDLKTMSDDGW